MSENPIKLNTRRILVFNEELNEQRELINSLLSPRLLSCTPSELNTSEKELYSVNTRGSYPLFGFVHLPVTVSGANGGSGAVAITVKVYGQNGEILYSSVKRLSANGAQSADIPFCVYPTAGRVQFTGKASSVCTLDSPQIYLLGC